VKSVFMMRAADADLVFCRRLVLVQHHAQFLF
jgi:hypothetical protein